MTLSDLTRSEVKERDDHSCQKCGYSPSNSSKLEIHHIKPQAEGGSDDPENLALLCKKCHRFAPGFNVETEHRKELFEEYVRTGKNPYEDLLWFGTKFQEEMSDVTGEECSTPSEALDVSFRLKEQENSPSASITWIMGAELSGYGSVMELTDRGLDDRRVEKFS